MQVQVQVQGAGGRRYRLLPYEERAVGRRRALFARWPETAGAPTVPMMLRMAAFASLRLIVAVEVLPFVVAMVMVKLTRANGGPLVESGSPVTPAQVIAIVAFWGLILAGVSFLGLGMIRLRQASREHCLAGAA